MEITVRNAPYAPTNAVVEVIRRFRDRGLPQPVTKAALEQVGISQGNASRTLQALKFLGLVDEEEKTTDTFARLRQASTEEYPNTLGEVIRSAYHSIFGIVDPAQDALTAIDDAFRGYSPASQRDRMVRLFMGLCHEAGIISEEQLPKRQSQSSRQKQPRKSTSQGTQQPKTTTDRTVPDEEPRLETDDAAAHDYRLVNVLVQQLPKDGKWTDERRTLWVNAMTSAIDLLVERVNEPEAITESEQED